MLRKLLVALHPGYTHTPALDRAKAIAEKAEVEVMLYSAVYDEHFSGLRFGDGQSMQKTRNRMVLAEQEKLEESKAELVGVAKSVSVNADWHFPTAQGISEAANAFEADVIIVSSSHHSKVARWLLTNTDWDILREASMPVLIAHQRPFEPYKTVVAAVDPTHTEDEHAKLDHDIVERGRWLADCFEGTTQLAHAFPSANSKSRTAKSPHIEFIPGLREAHTTAVHEHAKQHKVEPNHVHLLDHHVSEAIPALAKELSADLVVMGAVSRSVLDRVMIGRTAERVIDRLECDVLVIPLPDKD